MPACSYRGTHRTHQSCCGRKIDEQQKTDTPQDSEDIWLVSSALQVCSDRTEDERGGDGLAALPGPLQGAAQHKASAGQPQNPGLPLADDPPAGLPAHPPQPPGPHLQRVHVPPQPDDVSRPAQRPLQRHQAVLPGAPGALHQRSADPVQPGLLQRRARVGGGRRGQRHVVAGRVLQDHPPARRPQPPGPQLCVVAPAVEERQADGVPVLLQRGPGGVGQ